MSVERTKSGLDGKKEFIIVHVWATTQTFPYLTTMFIFFTSYNYDLKLNKLIILKHHHLHAQLTSNQYNNIPNLLTM